MMRIFLNEMKQNRKNLFLWALCVGGLCLGCILLYTSLEDSLKDIADSYSNMGAMSVAFGMDKISIATLTGFFATEIALMHGLGGAMFAALIGSSMISKEEAGHTSEFLNTLPVGRESVLIQKYLAMVMNILLFHGICFLAYLIGFLVMGEEIAGKEMLLLFVAQFLLFLEIGTISFLISSCAKKNLIGAGLGMTILFYAFDVMCRIIPVLKNGKYVTPFYYANAPDIFTDGHIVWNIAGVGIGVTVICFVLSLVWYRQKDLAS